MFNISSKRTIVILMSIIIVGLLVTTFYLLSRHGNNITESEQILHIPNIELNIYNGGFYSLSNYPTKRKTIVLFFSPECDLCENELQSIIENKEFFINVRWIFITQSIFVDELSTFLTRCPIKNIENSNILIENHLKYHSLYEVTGPPAMFVYDDEGQLIHSVRGSVGIDLIIEWLK